MLFNNKTVQPNMVEHQFKKRNNIIFLNWWLNFENTKKGR